MKKVFLVVLLISIFFAVGNIDVAFADTNYIKWIDFNPSAEIMRLAYNYDINSKNNSIRYSFIELLAFVACQNGNNFNYIKDKIIIKKAVENLNKGISMEKLTENNKYYNYYLQSYSAVLGAFVGNFIKDGKEEYGLKTYYPLAKGYYANEFDDFGQKRNFGYNRPHLGHDYMGSVGTPIVAVEGGIIKEIGWNKFGGWRIGILSQDGKRFYYYAHLRKGKPYADNLALGDVIDSGQLIGFLGATGYSTKPNSNMKCSPHLHFGMQIIFDPAQYNSSKEIWIDVYQISRFLINNRAYVPK